MTTTNSRVHLSECNITGRQAHAEYFLLGWSISCDITFGQMNTTISCGQLPESYIAGILTQAENIPPELVYLEYIVTFGQTTATISAKETTPPISTILKKFEFIRASVLCSVITAQGFSMLISKVVFGITGFSILVLGPKQKHWRAKIQT